MDKLMAKRRRALNAEDGVVRSDGNGSAEKHTGHQGGHRINHNGHKVTKGIHPDGESGRKGIHPIQFLRICFRSSCTLSKMVNVLWPFVPPAIVLHFACPHQNLWIFILNYIAMVPAANLIGFAGQELARKLPKVFGVLLETFLGGIVEIILFMVLLHRDQNTAEADLVGVIRAAILGSILANVLLCLGFCFFVGGVRKGRDEQHFSEVISEVGSNLLLVAGFGLLVPSAFYHSLIGGEFTEGDIFEKQLHISRITAVILLIAFLLYVFFQMRSHHSLYDDVLTMDEEKDADRDKDLAKAKLTLTEFEQIEYIVHVRHVSDSFVGLILVPLVEKVAEHLTAVDEAWDNQMNFALAHVLGATIQTALFNGPLVVIVGWGLAKNMDLNFETFYIVVLILGIIVIGGFLRDQKSNYLEGALCILIYMIIAIAAWYYPDPPKGASSADEAGAATGGETAPERLMRMAMKMR
ncbi:MAG: hypothetical protein OHK93_008232 [Ramalina farinacea]|uniref:Sodium/calcium exchanger membrane region domain-containing protein n=1 Tax=Ramalina farinacea TaxID=258253 RepID=A0AA43TWD0_9LECA|nr:hypothetical protein [Ramalina farinacea]